MVFQHRWPLAVCLLVIFCSLNVQAVNAAEEAPVRIGIIGLDTSHSIAFAKEFNQTPAKDSLQGFRVVAAYPYGSRDIESSASRMPKYTEEIKAMGIEITESIPDLLAQVDCVLLETNDGRLHVEQAWQIFQAGKPVFIDKPVAASLVDVLVIYAGAAKYNVPMFSSSSLRYSNSAQEIRRGSLGKVTGCDAYSPCSLEPTHSELYWYGIHGVETLYTAMGVGCETVSRTSTENFDVAVGRWNDGRIGTFRGIRSGGGGYGGTVFGEQGVGPIGPYEGYGPLVDQIAQFFRTKEAPIPAIETIEIYAFMEAAAESKRQGGNPVAIADVLQQATAQAETIVAKLP